MSDRTFTLAPSDIDRAFEQNEFTLVFQPKVEIASGRMTGAEAFVRWQHPVFGLLPPGLFLDFVEAHDRMADLNSYIFHMAFDAARAWKQAGRNWTVSINVTPGIATAPDFCEGLAALVAEYGLDANRVIVEIPERAVAQEPEQLCEALNNVRGLGVNVALDGGGVVPIDLSRFNPMPFNSIKVGGPASIRLAQRLGLRGQGAIAARLRFARQYCIEAVAVGAEDELTMEGLEEVGFTAAQGIWICQPLTLDELLAWDGTWAHGNVATETPRPDATRVATPQKLPATARAEAAARPAPRAVPPAPLPLKAAPAPVAVVALPPAAPDEVTTDDIRKALEIVRARRAGLAPAKRQVPVQHVEPAMPVLDGDDVEDVVEDEETAPPMVKQQGFGLAGDRCPPMKGLVERRSPTPR